MRAEKPDVTIASRMGMGYAHVPPPAHRLGECRRLWTLQAIWFTLPAICRFLEVRGWFQTSGDHDHRL
jgi:hypothetical protein